MPGELSLTRVLEIVQRATQIGSSDALDTLLTKTLDLFVEVSRAEAGTLYLYDGERDELVFLAVHGDPNSRTLIGRRIPTQVGIAGATLRANVPIFVDHVQRDPRWDRHIGELQHLDLHTMYCLPLATEDHPVGVVQVFNVPHETIDDENELSLLRVLGNVMVSTIDKARLLDEAKRRENRQRVLAEIQARLTTTLDRNDLLTLIMNHARDLLGVEATSVWELDEANQELVLHVATGSGGEKLRAVKIPVGQGIIGHVVATGEVVLVEDVTKDERHYQRIDQQSGFVTRSILCVPLRAQPIQLGPARGEVQARIIGGAQALNKVEGTFTREDLDLFSTFASQAATALQISRLYSGMQNLFNDIIRVVAELVDMRDPYTNGHSQRVAEFAVEIARELQLPSDYVYQIEVCGILHDIGKIGVPEAVLQKPGRLTEEEFDQMKRHPVIGYEAVVKSTEFQRQLAFGLPGILEHHIWVNGRGYPGYPASDRLSLAGQIVHVADVFDALTSVGRPYRTPMDPDQAIDILKKGAGAEFDTSCIEAFCRARMRGRIRTHKEQLEQEAASAVST